MSSQFLVPAQTLQVASDKSPSLLHGRALGPVAWLLSGAGTSAVDVELADPAILHASLRASQRSNPFPVTGAVPALTHPEKQPVTINSRTPAGHNQPLAPPVARACDVAPRSYPQP